MCEQTCPDVFVLNSGISVVKVKKVPSSAEQSCREAAENCPTEAISIEE
jgi:ferredoxin